LFTANAMLLVPRLALTLAKLLLALTVTEEALMAPAVTVVAAVVVAVNVPVSIFCWLAKAKSAVALAKPLVTVVEAELVAAPAVRSRPEAVVALKVRALTTVLADTDEAMVLLFKFRLEALLTAAPAVSIDTVPVVVEVTEATGKLTLCEELRPAVMPVMLVIDKPRVLPALLTLVLPDKLLPVAERVLLSTVALVMLALPLTTLASEPVLLSWALTKAKSALAWAPSAMRAASPA